MQARGCERNTEVEHTQLSCCPVVRSEATCGTERFSFLCPVPHRTAAEPNPRPRGTRGGGEPATTSMRLVVLVITPCVINEVGHRARQGSAKCSTATSTKSIGAAVNRQFYTDARTPAGPVVPLFFGVKS
jgi:hypothetical protein